MINESRESKSIFAQNNQSFRTGFKFDPINIFIREK